MRPSLLVQVLVPLVVLQVLTMLVGYHVVYRHLDRISESLASEQSDRLADKVEMVGAAADDLDMVERFVTELASENGQVAFLGLMFNGGLHAEIPGDLGEEAEEALAVTVARAERFLRTQTTPEGFVSGMMQGRVVPIRLRSAQDDQDAVAAAVLLYDGSHMREEVRQRNRSVMMAVGVIWLVFYMVLALLLYERVIRRIRRLSQAVEDAAEGELPWRPDRTRDEITRLGERFGGALRAHHESEARFQRIMGNARDVIFHYEFHPVPRFRYVSPAIEQMLGYTPQEMYDDPGIGMRMIHPEDRALMADLYAGDVPATPMQLRWLHRDGSTVWTEQLSVLLHDETGRLIAVEGIGRDITARREAERARRESEALLMEVANTSPALLWICDAEGSLIWVNARWLEHTGRTLEQEKGNGWMDGLHAEERAMVLAEWRGVIQRRQAYQKSYRLRRHDGAFRWFISQGQPRFDEHGDFIGFMGTLLDITAQREADDSLRQAAAVFAATRDGVFVTDAELRITAVNRAYEEITGYSEDEVVGVVPEILGEAGAEASFHEDMWRALREDGHWQGEVWNRRKSGENYPEWLSISSVSDEMGRVVNYVAVFTDISRLKRQERRLEHLAHYDPLTGLPNRLLLNARLKRAIEQARRNESDLAVLVIDLDRFKTVNDSLGHSAGDTLLQRIVARLETVLGAHDTLARVGGDEFVLVRERLGTPTEAAQLAQRLIERMGEAFSLEAGREVFVGASIGISVYPDDGEDAAALLRNADAAMYAAKQSGRRTFRFYTSALTDAAQIRLSMETRLRRAIEQRELTVLYQPLVRTADNQPIGVEALVRWSDSEFGAVSPEDFIPVAEESGLINDLGRIVLREACTRVQAWRDSGVPVEVLSVNVSPRQIALGDVVETVREALKDSHLDPGVLELEITESALVENRDEAEATLVSLKELGVRIVIDDFGTGYSSLAYLRRFPVDKLKIDRSFMAGVPHDDGAVEIAATIVAMARGLNLDVVAEGVESDAQLAFLRDQKCPVYQGFHFSCPVSADHVPELFSSPPPLGGTLKPQA